MKPSRLASSIPLVVALLATLSGPRGVARALSPLFTYQGQLQQGGGTVNGVCDFQLGLFDAPENGLQLGSAPSSNVTVSNGLFTLPLSFGVTPFRGADRWVEIAVRCPAGSGEYTTLSPRQQVTATPYALYAGSAHWNSLMGIPEGFADGIDNDTIYSASDGLTLMPGNAFRIAPTYQLPQSCSTGNVTKWNGTFWACATDNMGIYSAGSGLVLSGNQFSVTFPAAGGTNGSAFTAARSDHTHDTNFWRLTGNSGTSPSVNFLGTTDSRELQFRVNGQTALRLQPTAVGANLIAGPVDNKVTSGRVGATIFGGGSGPNSNLVTDSYGTVGGGTTNEAGNSSTTADDAINATVAGGRNNQAGASYASVSGGFFNRAFGSYTSIAGGDSNLTSGDYSTIAGGSGNTAAGSFATVVGGASNTAAASYSVAAGRRAQANHTGSFVWADSTDLAFASHGPNQFLIRASGFVGINTTQSPSADLTVNSASTFVTGIDLKNSTSGTDGYRLQINGSGDRRGNFELWRIGGGNMLTFQRDTGYLGIGTPTPAYPLHMASGARCTTGGVWTNASDRNLKEGFTPTDGRTVLRKLAALPINSWNYKAEDQSTRHIGPTAQDFHAAFGLGDSDRVIGTVDADGVAMAAIQGLYQLVQEKDAQITSQDERMAALEARLAALEQSVVAQNAPMELSRR